MSSKEISTLRTNNKRNDVYIFYKYVSLSVLSMLAISFYIIVDTYFIADVVGGLGLAALNIAIPIFSLIQALALLVGIGSSSLYSIMKGAKQESEANRIFTSSFIMALIISLLISLSGLYFSKEICYLFGANEEIIDLAHSYIKYLLIGAPIFLLDTYFIAYIRNDANPQLASLAVFTSSISNIFLDYIFMYKFNLGIEGAIKATIISNLIGLLILSLHLIQKKNTFHISKEKIDLSNIAKICKLGFSVFLNELAIAIVMTVYNLLLIKMSGSLAVAAYGIISNISLVFVSILNGIGQGVSPIISYSYGRGDYKRVNKYIKLALVNAVAIAVLLYLFIQVFSDQTIAIFNGQNSKLLQASAQEASLIYFVSLPFMAFNLITINTFVARNFAKAAQVITLSRAIIFILPLALILSQVFSIKGLWLAYPVSEIMTFSLGLYLIIKLNNQA